MKKKKIAFKFAAFVLTASILTSTGVNFCFAKNFENSNLSYKTNTDLKNSKNEYSFNFEKQEKKDCINVNSVNGKAPIYSDEIGWGFVSQSCAMPPRRVNPSRIQQSDDGFYIEEKDSSRFNLVDENGNEIDLSKSTTHNFGGMIFRIKAPAGGYKIEVETTSGSKNTIVSVSAMQSTRIEKGGAWDAAGLVEIKNYAKWDGNTWSYNYANGLDFIDIEIEPKKAYKEVGIKNIKLTPIEIYERSSSEKPTIFTVGDSTVKTYTYNEAPMCGWGQVFDDLFDSSRVNVINYSMGGRSLKQMYTEGRLNDILMTGKRGDFVFIQSGHNDERNGTKIGTADGENARFGGGSTEEMYKKFLTDIYLPACYARGIIPVLVTPMSRVNTNIKPGEEFKDSFTDRKFPDVMREVVKQENVTFVDLNKKSVEYYNELGAESLFNIVMSLEAGETPGKTNSGSYANGHPDNKIDGTHFKEALAKQFTRMIAEEIYDGSLTGDKNAKEIFSYLSDTVQEALEKDDWSEVYPEICSDTITGEGSYYRNQIEKMVKLGIMKKDSQGNFNPDDEMDTQDFITAVGKIWDINTGEFESNYADCGKLTREIMASVLYDAYMLRFGKNDDSYVKPEYMTEYNGTTVTPDDPNYDPNLVGEEAQYYPLVGYGALLDTNEIDEKYAQKVEQAYNLGLIRSEDGIKRGSMQNGNLLEPKKTVTRAKAAKELYFIYVLDKPILDENNI